MKLYALIQAIECIIAVKVDDFLYGLVLIDNVPSFKRFGIEQSSNPAWLEISHVSQLFNRLPIYIDNQMVLIDVVGDVLNIDVEHEHYVYTESLITTLGDTNAQLQMQPQTCSPIQWDSN